MHNKYIHMRAHAHAQGVLNRTTITQNGTKIKLEAGAPPWNTLSQTS